MPGKTKKNEIIETTAEIVDFGLTASQIEAARMLASGDTVTATADACQVSRATLYRWQETPVFYCYVNKLRLEARKLAENSLFSLVSDATDTLRGCLTSPNDATRLNAAKYILDTVGKMYAGNTDPVAEIRQQHTTTLDVDTFGYVDEAAINRDLKKYGLAG